MAHEIRIVALDPILEGVSQAICQILPTRFGARCTLGESLAIPEGAYDPTRKQYRSDSLLGYLRLMAPRRPEKVLGVTGWDIYAPGLNFVFGHAIRGGRHALISTARLRPEFYGEPPNETLFLERVQKEAVHELGHVYGLDHCPDARCVMNFSNSIRDVDAKSSDFCPRCRQKLERLVSREEA